MSELKPCPFCGGKNVAQGSSREYISVWCFCGAQGPSVPFPDNCIDPVRPILECHEAWNRRASLPPAVGSPMEAEPVAWLRVEQQYHPSFPSRKETTLDGDLAHMWESHPSTLSVSPLFAAPASPDVDLVEALRKALEPFADIADFMDSETEGFAPSDTLSLICRGDDGDESAKFADFEIKDFYDARAALAKADGREGGK